MWSDYLISILKSLPAIIIFVSAGLTLIYQTPLLIYHTLYLISDSLINSLVLKPFFRNYIYQSTKSLPILGPGDRPDGATNCGCFNPGKPRLSTSFGMPSGHTQTMVSLATFWTLYINQRYPDMFGIWWMICGVWVLAILTAWSRVEIGYHTIGQVTVGGLFGVLTGWVSFRLWNKS